jgi:hypothetical protein
MTRENTFWHHFVAQHAGHSVLMFSTTAAIGALLCLFLLACWATGQVMARCSNCEAVPARCRCARAKARRHG